MPSRRKRGRPVWDAPSSFLPKNVVRAADEAADQVLAEDRALREHGIQSPNGRAR